MTALFPVPSNRSSDLLVQTRLLSQLAADQQVLLRVQDQLSSGKRIQVPSDDVPSAMRSIAFQRLIEQQSQLRVNVEANQSYLNATENAIGNVTDILNDIRGVAVGEVNAASTADSRAAAAAQIRQAIETLGLIGNNQFRGRYLFGGSQSSTPPFQAQGKYVSYQGNEQDLRSYTDYAQLGASNSSGSRVFGAVSKPVASTTPFIPDVTEKTYLSDLRRGRGITPGSIKISDGTNQSVVDLSSARTLGDVARLIEARPPAGREIIVRVTATGLRVEIDDDSGGTLTISESSGGTTANELGIRRVSGGGTTPIIGSDLEPIVRLTTPLDDLFGVQASGVVTMDGSYNNLIVTAKLRGDDVNGATFALVDNDLLQAGPGITAGNEFAEFSETGIAARAALTFSGSNNNLVLTANTPGSDFNNVTIQIVNGGALGNDATASYDAMSKTLTIGVDGSGLTDVQRVVDAVAAEGTFTAVPDSADPTDGSYLPNATIFPADAGVVTGNTGNSGAGPNSILVHIQPGETTANQVLAAIQAHPSLSEFYTVTLDEKDTPNAPFAGSGYVDVNASVTLSGGSGIEFDQDSGVVITSGGESHAIYFEGAETVEDLLNAFNGSSANVLAEINAERTGINVRSRLSGADFSIGENGGESAAHLGLRTLTESTPLSELNYGRGVNVDDEDDFVIQRVDGVQLNIDLSSATTVGDVLDLINDHPANVGANSVVARLARTGNGIELIDVDAGPGDTITVLKEVLSDAAWDLGLVPRGEDQSAATALSDPLAATAAVEFDGPYDESTAFTITASQAGEEFNNVKVIFEDDVAVGDVALVAYDGASGELVIDVDRAATTANTVIAAIIAEGTFTAALDLSNDPTNDGSGTIGQLGLRAETAGGAPFTLSGTDPNPQEVEGIFNALVRLEQAILDNDLVAINRGIELLDNAHDEITFGRAELGARLQGLRSIDQRLASEEIEMQSTLSAELDTDFVAAVSELTARQAALEASLQLMGRMFQLSLLNFL